MKKILFLAFLLTISSVYTSCSSDDTTVVVQEPTPQPTPEPQPEPTPEPLVIPTSILGKWKILDKKLYNQQGILTETRVHSHNCNTAVDYYRIDTNATGSEIRNDSDCFTSVYESFSVQKINDIFYLYPQDESFRYEIIGINNDNLNLKRDYAFENKPEDGYFIIDLYRM